MGKELAVTDEEKATMFRYEFVKVNSSRNLCEERKRIREEMLKRNPTVKDRREVLDSVLDVPFEMAELKSIKKSERICNWARWSKL